VFVWVCVCVCVQVLPQSEWRAPKNTIAIDIDDEEKDSKDQKALLN
jgi:hypothetical protein